MKRCYFVIDTVVTIELKLIEVSFLIKLKRKTAKRYSYLNSVAQILENSQLSDNIHNVRVK